MKKITLLLVLIGGITLTIAQEDITGTWYGLLKTPNTNLHLNFNITKEGKQLKTTMDSPDQGAFNIPTDKTNFKDNKIEIFLNAMLINYRGVLVKDSIIGTFSQSGMEFPLQLSKKEPHSKKKKTRPQDPNKPYPYQTEEVKFSNKKANNIKLSGTLSLPNNIKNPKVVILISGSGPQDRNSEIKQFNHRPFLVLADYLTKNGIAVLRFDDRGVGKSEGVFKDATSFDFATDVESAIDYLQSRKDINFSKIGLIGHSEGGLIAPIIASKRKDVNFIILLAGPGVDGGKILETQSQKISELSGVPKAIIDKNEHLSKEIHAIIKKAKDTSEIKSKLNILLSKHPEIPKNTYIQTYTNKWMLHFVKTNPQDYLKQVTCPILALNGSKDVQVVSKINLEAIHKATKENKKVSIKEIEGLNHLFQSCKTGNINEYGTIEETFSPKALLIITNWINSL